MTQYASLMQAADKAMQLSRDNESPVALWHRDGWYAVCEEPPDDMEPNPAYDGWSLHSVIEYQPPRKLSTYERHQLAADAGFDTWDDYRGEK